MNIAFKETYLRTITNKYGFFLLHIPAVQDNMHQIISFTGYTPHIQLIDSIMDKGKFSLSSGIDIEEVDVTYRKKIEERAEMSMFHLPLAEIELMPQLFQEDLIKSIQFLPGIIGGQEGSAGMYVRGGETERIWNFSIYNLYNRKNPLYYEYIWESQTNGNQLYKFSMFPIMPSVSYSIKF